MTLPIDVIKNINSMVFRWRQLVSTPVGVKIVDHQSALPPTLEKAVADLIDHAKSLQRFKDWVHQYLDAHGVPEAPPGVHGKEGCRIGDRMDWLMKQLTDVKKDYEELKELQKQQQPLPPVQVAQTPKRVRGG